MSRGGRIVAGLFLAAFGVALAAGVMEVGVRVMHLVPTRFWQPDPLLGTRLIPGKEGWWTQEEHEFRVPVRINSLGCHDIEHSIKKPDGSRRVLLLGDSHVEALQVPLQDSIGRQLERRLRSDGANDEVVSAGVSGYGTASELLYFRERGWQYSPDLVLLAFYPGNDVKNNGPALEKSLRPEYAADGSLLRVHGGKPRVRDRSLLGRSQAYAFWRKLILTRQPALAGFLVRVGLVKKAAIRAADTREGVPLDYWVYADPVPPEWQDAWRHTERNLDDLRDAVAARGARFAIVIVTARDRVYRDSWETLRELYPRLQKGKWDLEAPDRRVLAWCESRAVPCLQLYPAFAERAAASEERLHYVYDGHWTSAGHALAAKLTAQFILRESLL